MKLTESANIQKTITGYSNNIFLVCDREWIEKEVIKRKNKQYDSPVGNLISIRVVTSSMPCGKVSKLESDNIYECEYQIWYEKYDHSKEIEEIANCVSKFTHSDSSYSEYRNDLICKLSDYIISMGYYDFEKKNITALWI